MLLDLRGDEFLHKERFFDPPLFILEHGFEGAPAIGAHGHGLLGPSSDLVGQFGLKEMLGFVVSAVASQHTSLPKLVDEGDPQRVVGVRSIHHDQ